MLHRKFVLTSHGYLRIGVVHMHRDLLQPGDHPMGGGFWDIDYTANRLVLSGRSFDFGEPQWGVVNTLHVPHYCPRKILTLQIPIKKGTLD